MSQKTSPTRIGAFVLGALALGLVGLMVFGSGRLFRKTAHFVIFFPGSVDGLEVGAPVKLKGVPVGSVTDIRLRLGTQRLALEPQKFRIPVSIEIDEDKIVSQGAPGGLERPERLKELIDQGLRARLATQSLVTGLLFVQLDFFPGTPVTLVLPPSAHVAEIPSIPTPLEEAQSVAKQVFDQLKQMNLDEIVASLQRTADGVDRLVNAPGLHEAVAGLPKALDNLNATAASLRRVADSLDRRGGPLLDSLKQTADQTGKAVDQARRTLATMENLVRPDATLATQLNQTLVELSDAARSVRLLADYVERNPSALVRGRDEGRP